LPRVRSRSSRSRPTVSCQRQKRLEDYGTLRLTMFATSTAGQSGRHIPNND
jgi:hypothetical protein